MSRTATKKPEPICVNCREHIADMRFKRSGGVEAWMRGEFEPWCECCVRRLMLDEAREAARGIPVLEKNAREGVPSSSPT